VYDVFWKQVVQ